MLARCLTMPFFRRMAWLLLIVGLGLLTAGAEALVRGGAGLALKLGLTPLVIGLTVVAFGTSSPELVVSTQATLRGEGAIAIGNVVGSNICNIALILGLCALIRPLHASREIIRRELPILIGVSLLGCVLLLDGRLGRIEGAFLTAGIITYTVYTVWAARRGNLPEAEKEFGDVTKRPLPLPVSILLTAAGLGLLIWGSDVFVTSAVTIATSFGLSPVVIGLTVVAVGTSMPELATSVVAVFRNEVDVAIGNVVGSGIFNVLAILGIAAMISPLEAPGLSRIDLLLMVAVAVVLLPMARTGGRVSRREGALLLISYIGYTAWMIERS